MNLFLKILFCIIVITCVINWYFSGQVYDVLFVFLSKVWYKEVFSRIEKGSLIFDIGIGTAKALTKNSEAIIDKSLKIIGIDINESYIKYGKKLVEKTGLTNYITFHKISIYNPNLRELIPEQFDLVYFSASFSLMPDPVRAL